MTQTYSEAELQAALHIIAALRQNRILRGLIQLASLKEVVFASIPAKQRQSRGITWVLQHTSELLARACASEAELFQVSHTLHEGLDKDDWLQGVAIFLMAEYGKNHPEAVYIFFQEMAASGEWVIREFAQAGFRQIIGDNKVVVLSFLQSMAASPDPNLRRFASETLRPVTANRWLNQQPEYSVSVLRLMFKEKHPYPRTSVGNNLSDLSRRQPELIYAIVKELVESGDTNSYWIAYRACRNLVKKDPRRVMSALGIEEYHYKNRNFYINQ